MSIFDKVLKSVGLRSKFPKRSGHVLGSSSDRTCIDEIDNGSSTSAEFDVFFHSKFLGMSLDTMDGQIVVVAVSPETEAFEAGVRTGYIVLQLEGADVSVAEDFSVAVNALERPVRVR